MAKIDFDNTLKKIQLSRQDFSNMTNTAYSTVSNWHDEKKPIPGWVKSWLENYIKAKDTDKIAEAVEPYLKNK